MRIKSIDLKNIRSHSDSHFDFTRGINIIRGENGAGKSTVIESIGFCAFGVEPEENIGKYLLRTGAKTGEISVELSVDGKDIAISRKINKNGTVYWRIAEAGEEKDLSAKEIRTFLASLYGFNTSIGVETVFKEVVGVKQGEFTKPFMDTPSDRAKRFDKIFGVEDYKKSAESLNEPIRDTEDKLLADRSKAEMLGGVQEEKENIVKLLKEAEESEKEILSETEKHKEKLEMLKKAKNNADEISSEKINITHEKKRISDMLEHISKQKEESIKNAEQLQSET